MEEKFDMHSKRTIEDLSINQIADYLKERYNINNTIINNASLETNNIKQRYGERIFSFFNIFLAATLISSFILYGTDSSIYFFNSKGKTFFLICSLTCLVLLIYTFTVFIKFYTQYLRQRIYRDINNLITIILNDCNTFFNGTSEDKSHVSIETLNSFFDVLYSSCEAKNKPISYKKILKKEWKGIIISSICTLICLILSILLIFMV